MTASDCIIIIIIILIMSIQHEKGHLRIIKNYGGMTQTDIAAQSYPTWSWENS